VLIYWAKLLFFLVFIDNKRLSMGDNCQILGVFLGLVRNSASDAHLEQTKSKTIRALRNIHPPFFLCRFKKYTPLVFMVITKVT
jgi:hypothetical protein